MDFSESVLGRATVQHLRARAQAPVLEIGSDQFTRSDLAAVSCFNFTAAQSVTRILTRALKVKHTRDLFERITPHDLALPRLGAISLAVIGAVFEAKGLGGSNPLDAWMRRHAAKDAAHPVVTFVSLKRRDEQERAAERREQKTRMAARRAKAHRLRVGRFEGRLREAVTATTH